MIHVYYGFGKGKTTSAIGAGMRAYGAGKTVLFVQFLKNNRSSELKAVPFDVFEAPDAVSFQPGDDYLPWVDAALDYIKKSDCDVVILDEFIDLIPKFLSVHDSLDIIGNSDKEFILTGHYHVKELTEAADYVTVFQKEKHPFDHGVQARFGIEY